MCVSDQKGRVEGGPSTWKTTNYTSNKHGTTVFTKDPNEKLLFTSSFQWVEVTRWGEEGDNFEEFSDVIIELCCLREERAERGKAALKVSPPSAVRNVKGVERMKSQSFVVQLTVEL